MIVVTGASGFIGSQIILDLLRGNETLLLVDHLHTFEERSYIDLKNKQISKIDASLFINQLSSYKDISLIIHMGAISNTAEKDVLALKKWNVDYTKSLWDYCTKWGIPFIYASSGATYGSGSEGFSDDHQSISRLKPLNLYGKSKHDFDLLALEAKSKPPHWYGLKFFNVYGPNENHKGRMASSIWHGFNEIKSTGKMTLFRSHNPAFKDGEQSRDFIFIVDILKIVKFLIVQKPTSGLYNCGTGAPSTFLHLAQALFNNLRQPLNINWIDTPLEFRAGYQYTTCAEETKLRAAGYIEPFIPLNEGVKQYLESQTL